MHLLPLACCLVIHMEKQAGKLLAFRLQSCWDRYHNCVGVLPAGSAGEDAAAEPLPPALPGSSLLRLGALEKSPVP